MHADVIVLPANQPADRFYRGGARIARFRGAEAEPQDGRIWRVPEDWVASTTCLAGEDVLGLSALPDGRRLVDAVRADPDHWLGQDHVAKYGVDTRLLVKLLDADQRLPVHAHPDAEFAGRWLQRAHGKVEAWHILVGGEVHLGLRETVSRDRLREIVDEQDVDTLLGLLHTRTVAAGDTVYVPAGTLHAIGAGVLLVELQEPEDLSVLLEWRDFELDGSAEGHLGLGFDRALESVEVDAVHPDRIDGMVARAEASSLLPPEAEPYFRIERVRVSGDAQLEAGYAVIVVVEGAVETAGGAVLAVGTTAVVPHGAGAIRLAGEGTAIVCRPPR